MRRILSLSLIGLSFLTPSVMAGPSIPDDVREHVKTLVDERICTGIVVGVIDESGTTFFGQGKTATMNGRPIDADTLFEIGSISKVFTSILLCEQVESGKMSLDEPVQKYLPENVTIPQRDDKVITLRMLATHHSGLPRMPGNFNPADPENPYADYTEKQLFDFLSTCELQSDPGADYAYSNLGMGLLGRVVARVSGKSYAALLQEGITHPLGMIDTCLQVPADKRDRFADGHAMGKKQSHWDFDAIAGAGAIRSTAKDMLRFLSFSMGLKSSPIDAALQAAQAPRAETGTQDLAIALGWHVWNKHGTEIIWHNGGTAGFHTFCGFRKDKPLGVVVFVNDSLDPNAIGLHLLEPDYELKAIQKSIPVDGKILDQYAGWYLMSDGFRMHITRDGKRLSAELTGQPAAPVYPVKEDRFIYRIVDAELEFERDETGKPTAVVLHQDGREMRFARAPSDYTPPAPPKEIVVDVKILRDYVGRYQLGPNAIFDVTLNEDQLMAKLTGQPSFPVFATSETEFFYKVVEARLTFVKDADGKVEALVLHQNGMDMRAERTN